MREAYARGYASAPMHALEVTVGIELRDDDEPRDIISTAHAIAYNVMNETELTMAERAGSAIRRIEECYGSERRAYFVEVEDDGRGVQVYDPRDFVKERCTCACAGNR
jgi:hypothetical protein